MDRNGLYKELLAGRAVHVEGHGVVTDPGHLPQIARGEPMRDEQGRLTRRGAELAIGAGQTVLLPNAGGTQVPVGRVQDLPEETVLAAGDAKRLEAHADDLDERYRDLLAERQRVRDALEKTQKTQEAGKQAAKAAEPKQGEQAQKVQQQPAAGGGTKPDAAPPVAQPARATHAAEQPHGAEPREPSPPEEPQPPRGRHR